MSDIITAQTESPPIATKQKSIDTIEHVSNKRLRLEDNASEFDTSSTDYFTTKPSSSSKNTPVMDSIANPVLPPSPQSEQTASTSSNSTTSSNSEWTNLLKDHRIPVPYNDFQNPRQLLSHLIPNIDVHKLPSSFDDFDVCRLIYQLMANSGSDNVPGSRLPMLTDMFMIQREKLKEFNTIEQCVDLISNSKNIVVLTGAGCSVSCGIPDFRSRDGVYARLRVDFPDLPDPQAMFDIFYFDHDPRPFFKFAKEIYPGQFKPSLSHMFIKKLEENQKLLRNYTQNIDTLEMTAGIKNVIQCHGSFATATCTTCKLQVDADHIRDKILNQEIPYCEVCKVNEQQETASNTPVTPDTKTPDINEESINADYDPLTEADSFVYKKNNSAGILKPDIVFFGEGLPEHYHKSIGEDKSKCDLLIVIGSSLKVKPVANIPHLLPQTVPQILINRESLKHMNFDIELLGDCDVIVNELLLRLEEHQKLKDQSKNWSQICKNHQLLTQISDEEAENLLFANQNTDSNSSSPDISTVIIGNQLKPTQAAESQDIESTDKQKPAAESSKEVEEPNPLTKKYTTDYLRESSFLYLKPNMYVFHGAEIQLKYARKKLRRLNQEANETSDSDEDSDEDDDDDDDEEDSEITEESDEVEEEEEDEEGETTGESPTRDGSTEDKESEGGESSNKNNLLGFFNEYEDEEDEEDDEDFNPEVKYKNKKQLDDYIGDAFNKTKPDVV